MPPSDQDQCDLKTHVVSVPAADTHALWLVLQIQGVMEVHDLHIWSLKPGMPLLAAHINVTSDCDVAAVLHEATTMLRKAGIKHTTIQMVTDEDDCPCVPTPQRVRSRRSLIAAGNGSDFGADEHNHDHDHDHDHGHQGHDHAGHDHQGHHHRHEEHSGHAHDRETDRAHDAGNDQDSSSQHHH